MQHWILRCKHCQKQYVYCTYGNGPEYGTEAGCSREYCAECQKAIDDALNKIPVKFASRLVEIEEPNLFPVLEKIKEESEKNALFNCMRATHGEYDVEDKYTHDFKIYWVKYNLDTPNEKHLFIEQEFDIFKKELTGKYWLAENSGDSYVHGMSMTKKLMSMKAEPTKTTEPLGKLYFFDVAIGGENKD